MKIVREARPNLKLKILLSCILLLGFILRVYGLNWDQGYHLHPDERAIVLFTTSIKFPTSFPEFLSVQSPWNPHFFAYGSLPLYLLKIAGDVASILDSLYATYDKINLVGRLISVLFDIGTLLMVFIIGKKLFNKAVALFASFFYAISVLPIQLSHFYAVDTPLTFFVCITLFWLLRLYEQPSKKHAVFVGIFFGLALATKISASVLIASVGTALAIDFLLIFLKTPHKPHIWFPHVPKFLKRLFIDGVFIAIAAASTFIIIEPYALIDFQTFWQQTTQQRQMTYDPFTFPYTLQYVGKTPYFYELKNIFLFGLGPILATLSFLGTLFVTFRIIKHLGWWRGNDLGSSEVDKEHIHPRGGVAPAAHLGGEIPRKQTIIILTFFLIYFLVVGNFAIGFMRYLLPLYPFLCLFSAVLTYRIFLNLKFLIINHKFLFLILNSLFIILLLVWPLSFLNIYTQPNTRILASNWINANIQEGSTLALEHWDDGLPLSQQSKFTIVTLPLYDPDTAQKWNSINQTLSQTDYIILASNRLYVPLMKLIDCEKLPPGRCYKETAEYYKNLFDGTLGFQKVAEFFSYPNFSLFTFHFSLDDSSADESFTVYDHPKVIIFKKVIQ